MHECNLCMQCWVRNCVQRLGSVGDVAEARHVIEAAGVDTWFLKLPSGEWEEAHCSETAKDALTIFDIGSCHSFCNAALPAGSSILASTRGFGSGKTSKAQKETPIGQVELRLKLWEVLLRIRVSHVRMPCAQLFHRWHLCTGIFDFSLSPIPFGVDTECFFSPCFSSSPSAEFQLTCRRLKTILIESHIYRPSPSRFLLALRKSRSLAMRCQRHEEMVRALLVAQQLACL